MRPPPRLRALVAAVALAMAGTAFVPQGSASGTAASCTVEYSVTSQWSNGFQGSLTLTNHGTPLENWSLAFDFPGSQKVTQGWSAKWSQSGKTVTAVNESWNGKIATGGSVSAGFTAATSGSNPAPTAFTLNGSACTGDSGPTDPNEPPPDPSPGGTPPKLRVSGNKLVDEKGATRQLLGVNRSGGEFMCVQGYGVFDGPVDDASVKAIADWKVNAVRVPLNEECWLGLSHVNPAYAGANYITAVKQFVARLEAHGITPVLELHWSNGKYTGGDSHCPDTEYATCQKPMPNARYTPAFWTSVAQTFKNDPAVVFDLFNEPFPDRATSNLTAAWTCWRDGGTCPGIDYPVAGMQSLVNAVRATGAGNLVLVPGIAYSNDMRQWLSYRPTDPAGNLAAAWHTYNFNVCASESCWNEQLAPVAAQVPFVAGEIGENTCSHGYIDRVMAWLDARGASYLGWTWNTWDCSSGPSLISDYNGTPTSFGVGLRDHLKGLS
ncbi:cellulose binding domain-containing protein [Streptomyces sp. NRRL F-5135]|uniref:cellulose binding domain-containing protein n=1 Tax=Streptomyces sp. NRRL F-5135 TaxID=1463858 RepID=UPI0004C8A719|nr:cellulose binding domain-containing protein [Streptomyces sp. NRRL F-5135]